MEEYFEVLRTCPLFCGIDDRDLAAVLGCLRAKTVGFCKKETVLAETASGLFSRGECRLCG